MNINTGKRVLLILHWVTSIVFLTVALFPSLASGMKNLAVSLLGTGPTSVGVVLLLLLYALLSVGIGIMLFKLRVPREERGFITVDSSETGRVRISISATEHMVRQAVCNLDGIQDLKVGVSDDGDGIAVDTTITLVSGSHVPTVTMNMQRAIRQFVEVNCGVAVRAVSISIANVTGAAETLRRSRRGEVRAAMAAEEFEAAAEYARSEEQEVACAGVEEDSEYAYDEDAGYNESDDFTEDEEPLDLCNSEFCTDAEDERFFTNSEGNYNPDSYSREEKHEPAEALDEKTFVLASTLDADDDFNSEAAISYAAAEQNDVSDAATAEEADDDIPSADEMNGFRDFVEEDEESDNDSDPEEEKKQAEAELV